MENKWVIHYSADDYWNSNPHSRHHITQELNKHYKILWINPIGSRMPSIKKKGFSSRIVRKLKSLTKLIKKINDDFYVTTIITFPSFKDGLIQKINRKLTSFQLKLIASILKIEKPIAFYTSPIFADTLDMLNYNYTIYYYSDLYTAYREFSMETRRFTENRDKKLYENVDLILCASKRIFETIKLKSKKKIEYFPHQVDFAFFNQSNKKAIPEDIAEIKKPIIGYYGTLSDSNDWELMHHCAISRPQYNFVFIGRKDIKQTGLEGLPNVYFLGKKSFVEIPIYGNQFDVGIMFWVRRDWIINCSPLKLKEYLSLGIPVVSTRIEEVEMIYGDIVYIAEDKVGFLEKLDLAINTNNQDRIEKGINMVKSDSWYNAVKIIQNGMAQKN